MVKFGARINFSKESYFSRMLRWQMLLSEQSCKVVSFVRHEGDFKETMQLIHLHYH